MTPLRTAAALSLVVLALYLLQPAAANPLPYTVKTSIGDRNGDGIPDPAVHVYGGYTCGCYCPVYTTTLHIEAAGQQADAHDVSGGCWMDDGASVESGPADPTAQPVVDYSRTCWGPCINPQ